MGTRPRPYRKRMPGGCGRQQTPSTPPGTQHGMPRLQRMPGAWEALGRAAPLTWGFRGIDTARPAGSPWRPGLLPQTWSNSMGASRATRGWRCSARAQARVAGASGRQTAVVSRCCVGPVAQGRRRSGAADGRCSQPCSPRAAGPGHRTNTSGPDLPRQFRRLCRGPCRQHWSDQHDVLQVLIKQQLGDFLGLRPDGNAWARRCARSRTRRAWAHTPSTRGAPGGSRTVARSPAPPW